MKIEIIEGGTTTFECVCEGILFKDGVFLVYKTELVPYDWDIAIVLAPGQQLVKRV